MIIEAVLKKSRMNLSQQALFKSLLAAALLFGCSACNEDVTWEEGPEYKSLREEHPEVKKKVTQVQERVDEVDGEVVEARAELEELGTRQAQVESREQTELNLEQELRNIQIQIDGLFDDADSPLERVSRRPIHYEYLSLVDTAGFIQPAFLLASDFIDMSDLREFVDGAPQLFERDRALPKDVETLNWIPKKSGKFYEMPIYIRAKEIFIGTGTLLRTFGRDIYLFADRVEIRGKIDTSAIAADRPGAGKNAGNIYIGGLLVEMSDGQHFIMNGGDASLEEIPESSLMSPGQLSDLRESVMQDAREAGAFEMSPWRTIRAEDVPAHIFRELLRRVNINESDLSGQSTQRPREGVKPDFYTRSWKTNFSYSKREVLVKAPTEYKHVVQCSKYEGVSEGGSPGTVFFFSPSKVVLDGDEIATREFGQDIQIESQVVCENDLGSEAVEFDFRPRVEYRFRVVQLFKDRNEAGKVIKTSRKDFGEHVVVDHGSKKFRVIREQVVEPVDLTSPTDPARSTVAQVVDDRTEDFLERIIDVMNFEGVELEDESRLFPASFWRLDELYREREQLLRDEAFGEEAPASSSLEGQISQP